MGFDNIAQHNGIAIAVTGILIVFVALTLITVFISLLPRILESLSDFLPPETGHDLLPKTASTDEDEVFAAIGFMLYQRELQKRQ